MTRHWALPGKQTAPPRAERQSRLRLVASLLLFSVSSVAQQSDLTQLSLDDLMNVKVTSVSKKEQRLARTASAIFIITAEDIHRSGATNIPDLLRMVPGVDVAQIDANTWAVSARGLNGRFSNELLVVVDGRNIYTPTFGGVLWDTLDFPLEDIERIEVIRGPGSTIWGGNAVNGVVNIISKKAAETHGGMMVAGAGNLEQGFGSLQYGGAFGKNTDYRVYTKYFNRSSLPDPAGANGGDAWHLMRGGFRIDSQLSPKDHLALQGKLYAGEEGSPTFVLPSVLSPGYQNIDKAVGLSGGFLQSSWNHVYSARSDTSLQVSFERYKREDILTEARNTLALDFQHHVAWGSRQDIVWGVGYDYTNSDTQGNFTFSLNPPDLGMQLFSAFVQDEVALLPNKLYITLGTKLEHAHYTGGNMMPSARVSWTPAAHHMFWAAVSQADRTPAESDVAARANLAGVAGPGGIPLLVAFVGNPRFKNEGLTAYEIGYRIEPARHLSLDLASYYSKYDHQQTTEPGTPFFEATPLPLHLVIPQTFQNLMHGEAHGIEIAVNWKATDRWALSPGYAFEQIHMHLEPTSRDSRSVLDTEGSAPTHRAQLRSHLDLTHGIAWDVSTYFVDKLKSGAGPAYTRLDTGLTWQIREKLSFSMVGQNLVKDRHLEFLDNSGTLRSTLVKRSAYVKLTWQF